MFYVDAIQVLQEVGGDIDAAIEFLIEEQGAEYLTGGKKLPSPTDISHGNVRLVHIFSNSRQIFVAL